jgi:hypothetical protein
MNSSSSESRGVRIVSSLFSLIWHVIRVPCGAMLALLEPIVSTILAGIALLLLFTAALFRFVGPPNPEFPFWGMMGMSVGCVLLQVLYRSLMRLFTVR